MLGNAEAEGERGERSQLCGYRTDIFEEIGTKALADA
jgi:hypothetical protein